MHKSKPRNLLRFSVFSFLLAVSSPSMAWDVVFDPTAVLNIVQQLQTMKQQYDALKRQHEAMTGKTNMRQGLSSVSEIIPNTWQDVVKQQQQGTYGATQKRYNDVMNSVDAKTMQQLMSGKGFSADYNSVTAGFTIADASYDALNTHINNLKILSARVSNTNNIKEAQDLSNAIAIEQAQIQTIMARLSAVQSNLSGSQLNRSVQDRQSIKSWNQ